MTAQTVLIADDDADLLDLLSRRCRTLGLGVDTAADAMTALRKIDLQRPDVVILDVGMPGGNGLSVREMMVENRSLASIPVIILTGRSDEETIRRCYNSSAYYVAKCPNVWPRIEPLLREILGLELPGSDVADTSQTRSVGPVPYEQSDQKMFFDWIYDLLAGNEQTAGDDRADAGDRQAGEPAQPVSSTPWVLCIDDDSELSFSLQMRLQDHGVEVLRAFSGMEGYRHAFMCGPRAIILDYEMPNGKGDYVLRRLKETPATRDIPVIVLTGRKDRSLERTMFQLGADEFLTKPCPWDTLWPILQRYLDPVAV